MLRSLTTGILLLAAALLLLGALAWPWWSASANGTVLEIGVRDMTLCVSDACSNSQSLSSADSGSRVWSKLGAGTFAASLVAAVLLLGLFGAALLKKKVPTLAWVAGTLACFVGVLAVFFVLLRPDLADLTPGYGMAATLAGALLGASASIAHRRSA